MEMNAHVSVYHVTRVYTPPELVCIPEANDPYEAMTIYIESQLREGAQISPVHGDGLAFAVKSRSGLVSRVRIVAIGNEDITQEMDAIHPEDFQGS